MRNLVFTFIFFSIATFSLAQIQLTSPYNRAVYQRLNGKATVTITGTYSQNTDKIEARFTKIAPDEKAGETTGFFTIAINPRGGFFNKNYTLNEGWYKLEARASYNGVVVATTQIDKVGVGEVFLIAGQSNAQGYYLDDFNQPMGVKASQDDRVNCVSNFNAYRSIAKNTYDPPNQANDSTTAYPVPTFAHIEADAEIAPRGYGAWYWGQLGDFLAVKLKVPILFFNVGWYGTSSRNWYESAQGLQTNSEFFSPFTYPKGFPYKNMQAVLNYYGSQFGMRSVLWTQGETDNFINTPAATYQSRMDYVIKKSRSDFGKDLAWVVARASFFTNTKQSVIDGQNAIIQNVANVYPGPYTDAIGQDQRRGMHYVGGGLTSVAKLWADALDDNFFTNTKPIAPDTIASISYACLNANNANIALPAGYASYKWSNGATTRAITAGTGTYSAKVTTSAGNIVEIPAIKIKTGTPPTTPPTITSSTGQVVFCSGQPLSLSASPGIAFEWSNGAVGKTLNLTAGGSFSVKSIDENGCVSPVSPVTTVTLKPSPQTPVTNAEGPVVFCDGESVNITASTSDPLTVDYLWSNGSTGKSIKIKQTGNFTAYAIGSNGCSSTAQSPVVTVRVNPNPATPQITALSDTIFCEGGSTQLAVKNTGNLSPLWTTGSRASGIDVNTSGMYQVSVIDVNQCKAVSNIIFVTVIPNPDAPSITASGVYFLKAVSNIKPKSYLWKVGTTVLSDTSTIIRAKVEGGYTVSSRNFYKNNKECISKPSAAFIYTFPKDATLVSIYPNPSATGKFSLEPSKDLTDISVRVFTQQGIEVLTNLTGTITDLATLDLTNLPNGEYIIRIKAGTETLTRKLVIVR